MRSRKDTVAYNQIAQELGVPVSEVRKAVLSFFDCIVLGARKLPFDNPRKIYTKKAFDAFQHVHSIPFIGRIGTNHSRYMKWRANESKDVNTVLRSSYKHGLSEGDIELIAENALAGVTYVPEKKKNNFQRIWMVGENGKRQARQVIPKD